jgi:hypothetical protein
LQPDIFAIARTLEASPGGRSHAYNLATKCRQPKSTRWKNQGQADSIGSLPL